MKRSNILIYSIAAIAMFLVGVADSPAFNPHTFKVDPAYIEGILTASGILYGMWAVLIEREPRTEPKKSVYPRLGSLFLFTFSFLVLSVFYIALTALNLFSSTVALVFCTFSFMINALAIALTLYYFKFKT